MKAFLHLASRKPRTCPGVLHTESGTAHRPATWLLAASLCIAAHAQTPATSNTPAPRPQPGAPAAPANKTAGAIPPSRLVGPAALPAYVRDLSASLSINRRATDPFGKYQDPDARPVIKTQIAKTTRRAPQAQTFPFSDIINRIKVNTVMPGEKKFLIGTRTFRQGETMSLTFRMKNIPVEIVSVTSSAIGFRNVETGETATLKMYMLPAGMTPGTNGIHAPGMIREQKNAPVDLDSPLSPDEAANNR